MAASRRVTGKSQHYAGDVKRQLRHGYGIYVYTNSFFRYEGEWKNGKKHGHGKLLFTDGSYYEGEFVHGEITGNGLRYWATSGNKYSGEFEDGERHGHGVMNYKDGGRYEGAFVLGMREGHGLLMDKDGQTYSGAFHNNKKYGEGQMSYQNGNHYEGNWVLDKRQGHGVLHCLDGTLYEGQWRNDVFNGQGAMIHCSGVIYDGLWINGHPADIAKQMAIIGKDTIEVVQGAPVTFQVQLQTKDGELAEKDNGRVLRLRAGMKYTPANKRQSILELIEDFEEKPFQTPFGYDCVDYPLSYIIPEMIGHEDSNALLNQLGLESSNNQLLPANSQPHPDTARDLPSVQGEYPNVTMSDDDSSIAPPNKRVEMGLAVFEDIVLGPLPPRTLHLSEDADKNWKKTNGKLPEEKTEKMTALQEKIGDSRLDSVNKERKVKKDNGSVDKFSRTGEYVIMVEDITNPPFLGHTLQPAFKLIRIIPEKAKVKNNRKSQMLNIPSS